MNAISLNHMLKNGSKGKIWVFFYSKILFYHSKKWCKKQKHGGESSRVSLQCQGKEMERVVVLASLSLLKDHSALFTSSLLPDV